VGYTLRAVAEIAHKDFAAAEKDLNTAISLAPNDPTPYTRMGSLRAIQKRFPEAEKFYEQALEKNPDFLEALRGLVAVDVVQKQTPKAVARVLQQIAKSPSNATYQVLLGRLYIDQKQLDQAEAAFAKATTLDR